MTPHHPPHRQRHHHPPPHRRDHQKRHSRHPPHHMRTPLRQAPRHHLIRMTVTPPKRLLIARNRTRPLARILPLLIADQPRQVPQQRRKVLIQHQQPAHQQQARQEITQQNRNALLLYRENVIHCTKFLLGL